MGSFCKIFGHKDEAINFWGEQAQYILFKCNRCADEKIVCAFERRTIPNNEFGKVVLKKMMTDEIFSNACRLHMEFVEIEKKYPFNFIKRESELKKLRENYGLPINYRPACPVELFRSGLWIDKQIQNIKLKEELKKVDLLMDIEKIITETKKGELEKLNSESKNNNMEDNKFEYTNEVQVVQYDFQNKPSKNETIAELEKLEKIYVEKENYEKAAEIHKRIQQLKNFKS